MIDLDHYRIQVEVIRKFLDYKNIWDYKEEVSMLALYCGTPIIAISYFIAELYGMTDEIRAKIESDCQFYRISEVINYRPKEIQNDYK